MRLVAITHLSIGYLLNLFKNRSELTQTSLHLSKSFIFGKIAAFTLCFALFLFFVIFAEKVRFLRKKRTFSAKMTKNKNNAKQSVKAAILPKINDFERCSDVCVSSERFLNKFRRYPIERCVIATRRICECVMQKHGERRRLTESLLRKVWKGSCCGKAESVFVWRF